MQYMTNNLIFNFSVITELNCKTADFPIPDETSLTLKTNLAKISYRDTIFWTALAKIDNSVAAAPLTLLTVWGYTEAGQTARH